MAAWAGREVPLSTPATRAEQRLGVHCLDDAVLFWVLMHVHGVLLVALAVAHSLGDAVLHKVLLRAGCCLLIGSAHECLHERLQALEQVVAVTLARTQFPLRRLLAHAVSSFVWSLPGSQSPPSWHCTPAGRRWAGPKLPGQQMCEGSLESFRLRILALRAPTHSLALTCVPAGLATAVLATAVLATAGLQHLALGFGALVADLVAEAARAAVVVHTRAASERSRGAGLQRVLPPLATLARSRVAHVSCPRRLRSI